MFSPATRSFSLVADKMDAIFTADATSQTANPLDTELFFVPAIPGFLGT
jgi:hypothetical protein